MKTLFCLVAILSVASSCTIEHEKVWECALNKTMYNSDCIRATDIHMYNRKQSPVLRPILLGIEGPKFRRLIEDCDQNNDACIEMWEATQSERCQRDCSWRRLFSEVMQCDI